MLKLAHQNGSSWVTSQWLELSSTCIYTVYDWVIASTHYQAPQTQLSEEWIVRQCVDAVKWTGLVTSALFHIWTLTTQLAGRGAFVINCKDAGRVSRDNGGLFSPFIQRGSLMGQPAVLGGKISRRTKKCTFQLHQAVHINIHVQTTDRERGVDWPGWYVVKKNPMTLSARCLREVFVVIRQPPESQQKQNCGHCYVRKVFMYFLCRWALALLWGPLMEEWLHECTDARTLLCSSAKQVIHKQQQYK